MKKIGIIYFSGTGNTEFVVNNMKDELEEKNISVDLINIEKDLLQGKDYFRYDALIIGAPVYVERYPEILFKYIKKIPRDYKKRCMLFTTQASVKATTSFQHFLNRVKYLNVSYCEFITMPSNFSNFMFGKVSDEEERKVFEDSIESSKKAVDNFLDGQTNFYPVKKSKVIFIDAVYKMFYPFLAKFMTRKIKIDTDKCVKCGLCEKRCPVSAIKIKNQVSINRKCLLCQRCMSNCPKDVFYYKDKKYIQYKLKGQKKA